MTVLLNLILVVIKFSYVGTTTVKYFSFKSDST